MPKRWIIYSPVFFPLRGGIETVVEILATEWVRQGIHVTVVTATPNSAEDSFPFLVLRQPSFITTVLAYRSADVVIFANISLWGLLPLLFCGSRRPRWVATHHIWYENPGRPASLFDRFKKNLARFADGNISVSSSVDQFLRLNAHVIANPYNHQLFRQLPGIEKNRDLVFLGRLVSDKGCDLLLNALVLLREQGLSPSLTIIGSGPEQYDLECMVKQLHLQKQVCFTGSLFGEDLVRLLNQHRIMVVPSRWNEPFGIVALEGIACGCLVIGSSGGGLSEAIGPCGWVFPNGCIDALAGALKTALMQPDKMRACLSHAPAHLRKHEQQVVSARYAEIILKISTRESETS